MNYRDRKPSHHGQPDRGATYPPYPFMVVNNKGLLVDFDGIKGELFDKNTEARIVWGIIVTPDGVTLKNGDQRAFWDNELMWPDYKAWPRRKDKEDQKPKTQILAAMCGHVSEVPIGA